MKVSFEQLPTIKQSISLLKIINASLMPLEDISLEDKEKMLNELAKASLLIRYPIKPEPNA